MNDNKSIKYLITILNLLIVINAFSQENSEKRTQINFFGHIEYDFEMDKTPKHSYFSIGEQDIFITSKISDRISFLGENVIKFDARSPSQFIPSIERAQLKFDYYKNHSFIIGKIHTPTSYWNDTYHHGRLFFPTIERPLSFTYLTPVHSTAIRFQGQNLGKAKFGYELVIGNGISSNDFFDDGFNKSLMAGVNFKPIKNFRIGMTYYYDFIENNTSGAHSGHTTSNHIMSKNKYTGNVNYELYSMSVSYFGNKLELLYESAYNRSKTDTLGMAHNFSNYIYIGYKITDNLIPLIGYDMIDVDKKDVHISSFVQENLFAGIRYEFNYRFNLKAIVMQKSNSSLLFNKSHAHMGHNMSNSTEFKIQFAYGF